MEDILRDRLHDLLRNIVDILYWDDIVRTIVVALICTVFACFAVHQIDKRSLWGGRLYALVAVAILGFAIYWGRSYDDPDELLCWILFGGFVFVHALVWFIIWVPGWIARAPERKEARRQKKALAKEKKQQKKPQGAPKLKRWLDK